MQLGMRPSESFMKTRSGGRATLFSEFQVSVAGRGSSTRQRSHVEAHERRNICRGSGTSAYFRTERQGLDASWKVLRIRQLYIEGKAAQGSEVLHRSSTHVALQY